jgi:hypothetical protein
MVLMEGAVHQWAPPLCLPPPPLEVPAYQEAGFGWGENNERGEDRNFAPGSRQMPSTHAVRSPHPPPRAVFLRSSLARPVPMDA